MISILECMKQHNQLVKRGNDLAVLSVGAVSLTALCAVLGLTV